MVGNFYFGINSLWAEAVDTVTLLENILIAPVREISPFQHFLGKEREASLLWQKIGEICINTYHNNSPQTKLANCGLPGIWVGFAEDCQAGSYHVFNLNMSFSCRSFVECNDIEKPTVVHMSNEWDMMTEKKQFWVK